MPSDHDNTRSFMALTPGTEVGHYRIVEKLGAGGMGEVYLAVDTKLNRRVALKFLPLHLCQDEDCRKRFTREAQAAAKLDHPNIAAIHEVGEYQGRPFFAMQVIEGHSLRDVIAGKDLPLENILEIAIQVSEGLQAAHDKGIIHRDIKPSNILLDSHGRVRIVDFGLAAIRGSEQLTRTGSTLGTIGYMSPEQVRGDDIDQRSDLFSLGVVLYELITKQNPFKRDSEAATLKAVSDDLPHPAARYRADIPDSIQPILDKALDKDVKTRYQHADDLKVDLMRVKRALESRETGLSSRESKPHFRAAWVIAGVVAFVSIGVTSLLYWYPERVRKAVVPEFKKVTNVGDCYYGVISPDGTSCAYSRRSRNKITVEVCDIESGYAITVFECAYAQSICWSPDSRELLIRGQERANSESVAVYLVPRLGGGIRKFETPGSPDYYWDLAWYPDGSKFVAVADYNRLIYTDKVTGDTTVVALAVPFSDMMIGGFSPDGQWLSLFAVVGGEFGLWLVSADGRIAHQISKAAHAWSTWAGSEYAIYAIEASIRSQSARLVRLMIDPKSGTSKGEPEVLLTGLPSVIGVSASADGQRLLLCQWDSYMNLWRLRLPAGSGETFWPAEKLTSGTSYINHPAISPDQRFVSYSAESSDGTHVYVRAFESSYVTQITHGKTYSRISQWSADSEQLAVLCTNEGLDTTWVAVVSRDGSQFRKIFLTEGTIGVAISGWLDWSGSNRIVLQCGDAKRFLFLDPETGDTTSIGCELFSDDVRYPRLSPDGTRLAAVSYDLKRDLCEIAIFSINDSTMQALIPVGDCLNDLLGWSQDGQWVRFLTCDKVLAKVNVVTRQVDTLVAFPEEELKTYGSSPAVALDESFVIYESGHGQNDMYLVEHFDPHVK